MPWKCRYFKDKNVERRIPIASVVCQDKSKWMNMVEKLFSISLFCYVRGAISQKIPTHQMENNYTVHICWKKEKKPGVLCAPERVSFWELSYQEPSADYCAVEQTLLMINSDFGQN